MPSMTDPHVALVSFQQAFSAGLLDLHRGTLDPNIYLHTDTEHGFLRMTYVRIDNGIVTAFVNFARVEPIDGSPCLAIGVAVPERHRNKGLAKSTVEAAIRELAAGFGRNGYPPFYVEAVVSVDNEPSKKVATAVLSREPEQITDSVSGLPALRFILKVETT